MNFFSNLKKIRKLRNVTQEQMSLHLGVKPNTISNYENGISTPDFQILEKIINFLDISADILLFGDVEELSQINTTKNAKNISQKLSQSVSQTTPITTPNEQNLAIENAYLKGKVDALKEMVENLQQKTKPAKALKEKAKKSA